MLNNTLRLVSLVVLMTSLSACEAITSFFEKEPEFEQARVIVAEFEAEAGSEKYGKYARSVLSDSLVGIEGFSVLERENLGVVVDEILLTSSALGNPETAARLGALTGANVIIVGSIIDITNERSEAVFYGVKTVTNNTSVEMRVRAFHASTGETLFSKIFSGKDITKKGLTTSHRYDPVSVAIKDALHSAKEDELILVALRKPQIVVEQTTEHSEKNSDADDSSESENADVGPRLVEVEFDPSESKAGVFINNKYVGNSPIELELEDQRSYLVRFEKSGFRTWESEIQVFDGLEVEPELFEFQNR